MTVHNHGIDPSCKERLVGECLLKPGAIVLDLEDDAVARFLNYHGADDAERPSGACSASYGLADLIRAQTKPARIPEPSDPAVRVMAGGSEWAKVGPWWVCAALNEVPRDWDYLMDLQRRGAS